MPGMMVEGEWKTEGQWQKTDGRFVRSATSFRGWISADGGGFPA
jgi:glutathionyl-hydroquinone reductase